MRILITEYFPGLSFIPYYHISWGILLEKGNWKQLESTRGLNYFCILQDLLPICHPNLTLIWPQTLKYFGFWFYFLSWNLQAPSYCIFSFLLFLLLFLQILARLVSCHSSHSAEDFLTLQLKNVPPSWYLHDTYMILTRSWYHFLKIILVMYLFVYSLFLSTSM